MKKALSILLALITAFSCFTCVFAAGSDSTTLEVKYCQTEARSMLADINAFRTGSDTWYWNADNKTKKICSGLSPLVYDYDLEKAAMQRAAEIIVSFSHERPNGTEFHTAYTGNVRAENLAAGQTSVLEVMNDWIEADQYYEGQGHRRNLLNSDITAVGIACVEYNGRKYWVQEFRSPAGSTVETPANDGVTTVTVDTSEPASDWLSILISFFRTIINFFMSLASILK
ncbi:MAG: CAP domain-containing protein [Clostridia bacterium]|nr:CAP domain-containing protein [Clostridia bacterium]